MTRIHPSDYCIDYYKMSQIIGLLAAARRFFKDRGIRESALNVHIPPYLHGELWRSMYSHSSKSPAHYTAEGLHLFDMLVVSGYENRIVACQKETGVFNNSPMYVIEGLERGERLTYTEIN